MVVYTHEEFMKKINEKRIKKDYPEENINLPPEKRKPKKEKKK